ELRMSGQAHQQNLVERALGSPTYQTMDRWMDEHQEEFLRVIVYVCEVPAPPFQEDERARFVAGAFRRLGYDDVSIDGEGNVVAIYPYVAAAGDGSEEILVISAHLDTVFPEGTDVRVRREGDQLHAPGVGDNSSAVAALIFLAQGMLQAGFKPRVPIVFLA